MIAVPATLLIWHRWPVILARTLPLQWLIGVPLAVAVLLMIFGSSLRYLLVKDYFDHIEPTITTVSWWYLHGHPLYPDWGTGQGLYGMIYGPLLYQFTGAMLLLSPTILMSKLPGWCAFWLAVLSIAWPLRPSLPSARYRLVFPVAACVLIAGAYWNWEYYNRADPYLLLFAALGLCSLQGQRQGWSAALAIGVLAGLSVGFKLHAALYLLPYAAALLTRQRSTRDRLAVVAIGTASSVLVVVIPFLDPDVSLAQYIAYLQMAEHHGLLRHEFLINLEFSAVLLSPFVLHLWQQGRRIAPAELVMGLVYAGCLGVTCVIAAKPGAGPHHLLPFLPLFAYYLVRCATMPVSSHSAGRTSSGLIACFLAIVVCYGPKAHDDARFLGLRWDASATPAAALQEVKSLYAAYPHASMGAGGNRAYDLTALRVVGVFAGAPVILDLPAWVDMEFGGVSSSTIERLVTNCRIPVWIIPRPGEPFSMHSLYRHVPLFSARFRELFDRQYTVVRAGNYYNVWTCRVAGGAGAPDAASDR